MVGHRVLVLTTSRADFGIYAPVLKAMAAQDRLDPALVVTGMHMSSAFGLTVEEVRRSGWPVAAEFPCLAPGDAPADIATGMGQALSGMSAVLAGQDWDALMVLGDRFEMVSAAMAAVPFARPIVHLHGGEETEGAIDNVLRHALSKVASLHFCATPLARRRLIQMGEDPGRVVLSGAPAIDSILALPRLPRAELHARFAIPEQGDYLLVTYHPVTLDLEATRRETDALFAALDALALPTVFTAANADTAGLALNARIREYVAARPWAILCGHFGAQAYYSAMEQASVMIGNSSSGIIEAASLGLGVVNIGDRQKGRERSANLIDCPGDTGAVLAAVERIRSHDFRQSLASRANIYGDGRASPRIAAALADFLDAGGGVSKRFVLMEGTPG
jgi:UDP-hydrolysing UDP-N-acetyl-D-glucosamine 2-epimerase